MYFCKFIVHHVQSGHASYRPTHPASFSRFCLSTYTIHPVCTFKSLKNCVCNCTRHSVFIWQYVLYSACIQSVGPLKALYTSPHWQTCSLRHQLDFCGKHSSQAAISHEDYSLTFPTMSILKYSFIQLSELGCFGENGNVKTSKR